MNVLQTRTSGHEAWLETAWLEIAVMTFTGSPTVQLRHSCGHHETYAFAPPVTLRQYAAEPCTACVHAYLREETIHECA